MCKTRGPGIFSYESSLMAPYYFVREGGAGGLSKSLGCKINYIPDDNSRSKILLNKVSREPFLVETPGIRPR